MAVAVVACSPNLSASVTWTWHFSINRAVACCLIVQVYICNSYKGCGSRVSCCYFSLHIPVISKVRFRSVFLWLRVGITSKDGSLEKTWIEGEWATFDAKTGASLMCCMQSQEVRFLPFDVDSHGIRPPANCLVPGDITC